MKFLFVLFLCLYSVICRAYDDINPIIGDWGFANESFGCYRITQTQIFFGGCSENEIENRAFSYSVHFNTFPLYILSTEKKQIVLDIDKNGRGMDIYQCNTLSEAEKIVLGNINEYCSWSRASQEDFWKINLKNSIPSYYLINDIPVYSPKDRKLPDIVSFEHAIEEYYQGLFRGDWNIYCKYNKNHCRGRESKASFGEDLDYWLNGRKKAGAKSFRPQLIIDRVELDEGAIVEVPFIGSDNWFFRGGKWEFGGTI